MYFCETCQAPVEGKTDLVATTVNREGDIPALCVQQRYVAEFLEMYTWQGIVFRKRTKEDVKNEDDQS